MLLICVVSPLQRVQPIVSTERLCQSWRSSFILAIISMLSIYLEPAQSQEVSNFSVGGKGLMKSLFLPFLPHRRSSIKIKVWNKLSSFFEIMTRVSRSRGGLKAQKPWVLHPAPSLSCFITAFLYVRSTFIMDTPRIADFGCESSTRFNKLVSFLSLATVQLQAVTSLPSFGWAVDASVCV